MKKLFSVFVCALFLVEMASAQQDEEKKGGFKKENFFTGGSLSLAYSGDALGIGVTPEFGYSLTNFVDFGIAGNYNYTSYRNYPVAVGQIGKLKQTIYGGGAFTRLFPVHFLFLQGQFEHNWINLKYVPNSGGTTYKNSVAANSLLVGAGYTTGRNGESKNAYGFFSILIDVLGDENSPYVSYDYDGNGNVVGTSKVPVIRAGLIVPLFQGK